MEDSREKEERAKRLGELRERLYSREKPPERTMRHELTREPEHRTPTSWPEYEQHKHPARSVDQMVRPGMHVPEPEVESEPAAVPEPRTASVEDLHMAPKSTKRRTFRKRILLLGAVFFFGALVVSSVFLLLGKNTISGANITVGVSGPFAIGGGDTLPLQISISNQNSVAIESATLVIEYPTGAQSADGSGKQLYTERTSLNNIDPGQVVNVPVKAIMYGEENSEKTITVSVEYRVKGSSATFVKDADPFRFKISSAPATIKVDSVKSISSGQDAAITLTVSSNSPTPLSGLLVKATYPYGFDFSSSDPQTVTGNDTWKIDSLDPEKSKTITVHGIVVGNQDEERTFSFAVGVANQQNPYDLASTFTTATTSISIEQPFLGVNVSVNNSTDDTVAVSPGQPSNVKVSFTNALNDTIYDGAIQVQLQGNALDQVNVDSAGGFYDSNTHTITWDSTSDSSLSQIEPGRSHDVTFGITPSSDVSRTPEIKLAITVKGKRIFENKVPQELVGTANRDLRVESIAKLSSTASHDNGPFANTGPTPPVVGQVTEYTLNFSVKNGSNDITGAAMTATLPPYMTWLNVVTPGDNVTYSQSDRTITWNIGNLSANAVTGASVQVSYLASASQVNTTPTLIDTQRLKATDRFTGTVIRSEAPALTTALANVTEQDRQNGRVQAH